MDTRTSAVLAAMKKAQDLGLVEQQRLPEAEYLDYWKRWGDVVEAAFAAAGIYPPWHE